MSLTTATPETIATSASLASRSLATLPTSARNQALTAIHDALASGKDEVLLANAEDLRLANEASERGELSQSVLKRLDLRREGKYEDMLKGVLDVRELEDPLNKVTLRTLLDDGLTLTRITCPIGVLLIIFEARPEVIANISALAIKSGNAAILKGGKETTHTFLKISQLISTALTTTSIPPTALQLVTSRAEISSLLSQDTLIDLVIPRGSADLVRYIKSNTKIPVLGHADGRCHIYLSSNADPTISERVILDSKLNYMAACNSLDVLLVDEAALSTFLPSIASALLEKGVSLRCDEIAKAALSGSLPQSSVVLLQDAVEADWTTEFLGPVLAIKTIPTPPAPASTLSATALSLAIAHINMHSSHHTDTILTSDETLARQFQAGVDSACVFWNVSTRMSDGMRFGFGTEVGISTNKVHARGPVGLEGLTIYKYLVDGRGEGASDYGEGKKAFKHTKLPIGE